MCGIFSRSKNSNKNGRYIIGNAHTDSNNIKWNERKNLFHIFSCVCRCYSLLKIFSSSHFSSFMRRLALNWYGGADSLLVLYTTKHIRFILLPSSDPIIKCENVEIRVKSHHSSLFPFSFSLTRAVWLWTHLKHEKRLLRSFWFSHQFYVMNPN